MITFSVALCAGIAAMLIMKTSRYRPAFDLAPAWRETPTIASHRLAAMPGRDWTIA